MTLGKLEKQVLIWLDDEKTVKPSVTDAMYKFARFTRSAGERSGHSNYAQISHLLDRLVEKGFIEIWNRNRTDCEIIRTEKQHEL